MLTLHCLSTISIQQYFVRLAKPFSIGWMPFDFVSLFLSNFPIDSLWRNFNVFEPIYLNVCALSHFFGLTFNCKHYQILWNEMKQNQAGAGRYPQSVNVISFSARATNKTLSFKSVFASKTFDQQNAIKKQNRMSKLCAATIGRKQVMYIAHVHI